MILYLNRICEEYFETDPGDPWKINYSGSILKNKVIVSCRCVIFIGLV